MRTFINLTLTLALVAIMFNVSFAANPATDSVQVTDSLGNQTYVLVIQDVLDSLSTAGNTAGAIIVGVQLELQKQAEAARKQAEADSLAREKEKTFWVEVDSTLKSLPSRDPRSAYDSLDFNYASQATAYFMLFGLDSAEARAFAGSSTDWEINMSVLMASYVDQEISRRTVELNGPAHSRLIKQAADLVKEDSVLNDKSSMNDAQLAHVKGMVEEAREGIELTFELANTNAANIETIGREFNLVKSDVWKALEVAKLAKLRGDQGDDNRRLMEELDAKSGKEVQTIALKK